jgi:cytochrome c oxidase subunit 4
MSHKIVQPSTYLAVLIALLLLTALTVGMKFADIGRWHLIVGLAIATTKATLVFLIFMHLYYSNRLNTIFALGGILWLAILVLLTMSDYLTRGANPDEAAYPLTTPAHKGGR